MDCCTDGEAFEQAWDTQTDTHMQANTRTHKIKHLKTWCGSMCGVWSPPHMLLFPLYQEVFLPSPCRNVRQGKDLVCAAFPLIAGEV